MYVNINIYLSIHSTSSEHRLLCRRECLLLTYHVLHMNTYIYIYIYVYIYIYIYVYTTTPPSPTIASAWLRGRLRMLRPLTFATFVSARLT